MILKAGNYFIPKDREIWIFYVHIWFFCVAFKFFETYLIYLISSIPNKLSLIGIILRWGFLIWELIFFIYCGLFVLILVVFVLFLLSLRFGQISPLTFFRWLTATSDRNAESCNRIPSNYWLPFGSVQGLARCKHECRYPCACAERTWHSEMSQ